jgi:hypothetical protein
MSNKKDKISDRTEICQKFLFLQINYNEFSLKILYIDGVG